MIGNLQIKPSARSPFVQMRFYGGPRDGEATQCVTVSELRGRVDGGGRGWHYALVGFCESNVPEKLKQFAMESAIYQWTNES